MHNSSVALSRLTYDAAVSLDTIGVAFAESTSVRLLNLALAKVRLHSSIHGTQASIVQIPAHSQKVKVLW